MDYANTQRAPLGMILYTAGLATVAAACLVRADLLAMWILAAAGALIVLVGLMFGSLTIRDEGSHLAHVTGPYLYFGGSFRTRTWRAPNPIGRRCSTAGGSTTFLGGAGRTTRGASIA